MLTSDVGIMEKRSEAEDFEELGHNGSLRICRPTERSIEGQVGKEWGLE